MTSDSKSLDYYQARIKDFNALLSPISLQTICDFANEIHENLIKPLCDKYHLNYYQSNDENHWIIDNNESIYLSGNYFCDNTDKKIWKSIIKNNEDIIMLFALARLLDTFIANQCISDLTKDYYPAI